MIPPKKGSQDAVKKGSHNSRCLHLQFYMINNINGEDHIEAGVTVEEL